MSTMAQAALFPVPPVKPTKAYSLVPLTKPQIFAVPLLVKGKKLFKMILTNIPSKRKFAA